MTRRKPVNREKPCCFEAEARGLQFFMITLLTLDVKQGTRSATSTVGV
jgi:hypothetical protein